MFLSEKGPVPSGVSRWLYGSSMTLVRSRWAAIGAAVAVTLGAGGLISVGASNDTSSLVPITPTRVLDTRSGDRVGSLDVAGASDPYRLKLTGSNGVPTSGVTAVSLNVTAVETQTNDYGGFLSVYPCASVSSTKPDVSNMNFGSGQTIANAVTVPVSTDGHICLYVYGTAHVLVDVNGFYTSATAGAVDAYTKAETDTKLGTKADQTTVDELETTVGTKADQTTVDELETTVGTKADQTTVDADVAALREVAAAMRRPLTIDSADDVGGYTSIAIGSNGYPVISYYDYTNSALKVAACTTAGCTVTPTISTIDSVDVVGSESSIAIGDNGYPVISYSDSTNDALKVAACTNADCTGTPTITTVDSDGIVGQFTSIAIGDNGYPVISYEDTSSWPNIYLKVAACTTTDCTGTPTITTVDSIGGAGRYSSIAIGDNGYPVISYYDVTNEALKVAACTTTDCTGTPSIMTVDSDGNVGQYTSIAIDDNGTPIISYLDSANNDLKSVPMWFLALMD